MTLTGRTPRVHEAELRELERASERAAAGAKAHGSVVRERANIALRLLASYRAVTAELDTLRRKLDHGCHDADCPACDGFIP